MFHAVRQWWFSGRGKVTARLFLFEFAVVVVGVLTAQALANWVANRAETRAINSEDERVRYEIGRASQIARVWQVAAPCLIARVEAIARSASTGAPVNPADLDVPRFLGYTVDPFPPDMNREFHARFGTERVDNYIFVSSASGAIRDGYRDVRRGWHRLSLLDPALGAPSPMDRATVRDVAIQLRSQLELIGDSAELIQIAADRLAIRPITSNAEFGSASPVSDCAEIWRTGQIWREAGR